MKFELVVFEKYTFDHVAFSKSIARINIITHLNSLHVAKAVQNKK